MKFSFLLLRSKHRKGFTLLELVVVIIIIGILAALAFSNFLSLKEKTLNKEAKAVLALIRETERIYRMDKGTWYPPTTATNVVAAINRDLKLSLPSQNINWTITINAAASHTATAVRYPGATRTWTIDYATENDPICTPSGGACLL